VKPLRSVLFWLHLAAGSIAGAVILVMSVTGALLALKPQILAAIEADARRVAAPPAGAARLAVQALLDRVRDVSPQAQPTAITLQADPAQAAAVALGRDGTIYVDPYTGRVTGSGSTRAQAAFRSLEDWHRWLGVSDENRSAARSVTAACNLAFFVLAITGPFLWLPRTWSWSNVRAVLWFRRQRSGRARDFNWHNAVGIWCAPALVVLTLTGVVMSSPWANALLYRLAGSTPPPQAGPAGGVRTDGAGASRPPTPAAPMNLDGARALAEARVPTWRSIALRLPARGAGPVSLSIVDARSWNQFARSNLTVDASSLRIVRWEPYEESSAGQKLRGWFRFSHTGELAGMPGQIVAGVASAGGALLVWTGLSLALRRLAGWRAWARRRRPREVEAFD
jgi:uncharacterized iron-regulated membrane protein